jgi:hypothetical protein
LVSSARESQQFFARPPPALPGLYWRLLVKLSALSGLLQQTGVLSKTMAAAALIKPVEMYQNFGRCYILGASPCLLGTIQIFSRFCKSQPQAPPTLKKTPVQCRKTSQAQNLTHYFRIMPVRAGRRAGKKFIGLPAGRDETNNATRMQSNK